MDKEMRWCGSTLSCFGIVYNRDVLKRLGIEKEPTSWQDLADPRLVGQIALADPNKSASVVSAFEMLIQEQMHLAVDRLTQHPGRLRDVAEIEAAGVREGWLRGLELIQSIGANTRYFTDQSPKIPLEVAKGDAAAGMCIDFYGRATEEQVRRPDGSSRIGFIAPVGGTAVTVDPIALMRGAPEPEVAQGFMEFVLSEAGQQLWNYRVKMPGGPETAALRRLPIRKDLYTEQHLHFMSDPQEKPFEKAKAFIYRPEWTGSTFNVIRFLVRVMCVDSHEELQQAWRDIAERGSNPRSLEALHQVQHVNYDTAITDLARILASRDKVLEVREAHRLTDNFRSQYQRAADFGVAGR
jgi:ABC-type Fe3+ transport system substrate-binding protein